MTSILITPKNNKEFSLINQVLKKMNVSTKILSDEDKEDIGLGLLMSKVDKAKKVSRDVIMKKLK